MMRRFALLLLSVVSAANLMAGEGTITGKVISGDEKGSMEHVLVVAGTNNAANTDENGYFLIDGLEFGTYEVSVYFIGYEKKVIGDVKVSAAAKKADLGTIELKESAIIFPDFIIKAKNLSYNDRYKGSNAVVTKMELLQTQPIGSEEILKTVAGLNVAGDMGISNRLNVGIRGSYPRRSDKVLILEDGSPIAPAPYLAPSAYYNPPTDRLDGIEVIKGADVLTYGANTMYGVINYKTKRPSLQPQLNVNLTGGENGYHSQFITYGGTWKNIGAELQVLNKGFDGFQDNTQSDIFNTTAKVFADLGSRASAYLKLNYHQEASKATYSGMTPFTFNLDPKQNPFDSDDLLTKRYAADLVYNYKITENLTSTTQIYASQFKRDWWRQNTSVILASDVQNYLGDAIFNDRYSYMQGASFTANDYVRIGRLSNGRETTKARNRLFRVLGAEERLSFNYGLGTNTSKLEIGLKMHAEQFFNQEITGDSSRFSRSGELIKDEKYLLNSASGYLKNTFNLGKLALVPMFRFELIDMDKFNLLSIASDPDNDGTEDYGAINNKFNVVLPGININYMLLDSATKSLEVYGGVYKGYTPPTSSFGFIGVNEEGEVNTSPDEEDINIEPETSLNFEVGTRGFALDGAVTGQVTYFNNNIDNFYSAGRKEAFETLGSVTISGLEIAASFDLAKAMKWKEQSLKFNVSATILQSLITSGQLKDSDLLKAKHTDATKAELIEKINGERSGYNVYFANDSLITRTMDISDFDNIESIEMIFGKDGIAKNRAPYTPSSIINIGLSYSCKSLAVGVNYNMVGEQYTNYLNFENETSEGAIGKLDAYSTIDVNLSYKFASDKSKFLDGLTFFVVGKNITDNVYKASRLHRVSSGIMPGGFRQINGGIRISL
jgi:Fe(3+) dicitrate transport protein